MADATPVVRQWLLLRILSARRHGVTVEEAAAELSVHQKTIRRDLQTLRQVGFRLEETRAQHGRKSWRLDDSTDGPAISFAVDEALALYLGRRFMNPLAGTPFGEAAESAFKKVRAAFARPALAYLEKLASRLHLTTTGAGDYRQRGELVDRLLLGIEDRRATHVVYRSARATEPVTYELHPYGLIFHRGSLYLVAYSRDHAAVRHFKVDRIEEVDVSAFPFQPQPDFDLSKHLASSFGVFHGDGDTRVTVRFSPEVARYVEESNWHTSQKLKRQKDGSLLAEFRLSTTAEIKQWILSFGRHAEAIAPPELREELRNEAASMAAKYGEEAEDSIADRRTRRRTSAS
jgi:predicted DNA-binding transcriptional regulator YafY